MALYLHVAVDLMLGGIKTLTLALTLMLMLTVIKWFEVSEVLLQRFLVLADWELIISNCVNMCLLIRCREVLGH